jgi:hypothetical protein
MTDEAEFEPPKDRWLALAAFVGTVICLAMACFEVSRAMDGNPRSWAYAIEWPLFGAFVIYMWRRLSRERLSQEADDDEKAGGP